jgi:DNA-binding HxlR family transcriptional regulator
MGNSAMAADLACSSEGPCPISRALRRVGDAWSMLILRDAGAGFTRFEQFRTSLGIAPNILTRRLVALTHHGLLEKRRYEDRPPRDEYVLTAKGSAFLPILMALGAWGRDFHGDGGTSRAINTETGATIEPIVIDRVTGRRLDEIPTRLVRPDRA